MDVDRPLLGLLMAVCAVPGAGWAVRTRLVALRGRVSRTELVAHCIDGAMIGFGVGLAAATTVLFASALVVRVLN
jgi:hypothetical protein